MPLEQQLREGLQSLVEPVDVDRVVASVEARRARSSGRRWPRFAAVAAVAMVLVGAGVFGAIRLGDEASETVTAGPATTDETPTTGTASEEPLRATLVLPTTTVEAGGTIEGEVVVRNDTGAAIELEGLCGSPFYIELRGEAASQVLGEALPQCLPGTTLPIGASRWPVKVTTEYGMCRPADGFSGPETPACDADGSMPTLPPGTYTAEVRSEEGAPSVAGVTVEVIPAR